MDAAPFDRFVRRVGAGLTRRGALAALLGTAVLGSEAAAARGRGNDPKSDGDHLFGRARHRNPRHDGDGKPNNNGHGNGHGHGRNRKGERGKGNGGERRQRATAAGSGSTDTGQTGTASGRDSAGQATVATEMVSTSRAVAAGAQTVVEVSCPAGTAATGGGYAGATSGRVVENGPILAADGTLATGWRVDLRGVTEAVEVSVYVFCLRTR